MALFNNIVHSTEALVWLTAFMATFIASVLADEQNERLRNGTFGAVAGTSVAGFAAIIQNNGVLVLIGVFGSAAGAIVGWVVYFLLCLLANTDWGRRLVEYHVRGLKGVRERIDFGDRERIIRALDVWSQNFRGMTLRETGFITTDAQCADYDRWATLTVRAWLVCMVDAFNLVLDALAEKKEYRCRATIIAFGKRGNTVIGKHWIYYSGPRQSHKLLDEFREQSVACRVLKEEMRTPHLENPKSKSSNDKGEDRHSEEYLSYVVFRLNANAVLSLDWPREISEDDPYVNVVRALIHRDVGPAIGDILKRRKTDIAEEVGLAPLTVELRDSQRPPGPRAVE